MILQKVGEVIAQIVIREISKEIEKMLKDFSAKTIGMQRDLGRLEQKIISDFQKKTEGTQAVASDIIAAIDMGKLNSDQTQKTIKDDNHG